MQALDIVYCDKPTLWKHNPKAPHRWLEMYTIVNDIVRILSTYKSKNLFLIYIGCFSVFQQV